MSKRETKKKNLLERIPTLEMIQKNPMSREEQELEDCRHADCRSWCVGVKDRCAGKHLQVEPLEREGRERTESSRVNFDCVFLMKKNTDSTLEYENEPSPEVFQEVKICSCLEVVV